MVCRSKINYFKSYKEIGFSCQNFFKLPKLANSIIKIVNNSCGYSSKLGNYCYPIILIIHGWHIDYNAFISLEILL